MFGLESPIPVDNLADVELPRFLTSPHIKLATGRSAFSLLNSLLSPKNVWLPAYLCGVVMGAFPARQTRIKFYPIDENLQVTDDSWLTEVAGGDMVVFIDYFGLISSFISEKTLWFHLISICLQTFPRILVLSRERFCSSPARQSSTREMVSRKNGARFL